MTAFVQHGNGLVAEDATIDAASLPKVQMPNRGTFIDLWAKQGDKPY